MRPLLWGALLVGLSACPRGGAPVDRRGDEPTVQGPGGPTHEGTATAPSAEAAGEPTWVAPPVRPLEGVDPAGAGDRRIVLGAVGDVLMHGEVQGSAKLHPLGYRSLFAGIEVELRSPDLTFANLETPVSPEGRAPGMMSFNAPVELLTALAEVGVGVVSVANNHIYDRGRRGLESTLRHLDEAGIKAVGTGTPPQEAGPVIIDVQGMKVGFLAWTQVLNGEARPCATPRPCPQVAVMTQWDPVLRQVRAVAPKVDALVVSLHWGTEYALVPDEGQVTFATLLVQAGVDVVLGHHPHVPQRVDRIRRKDGSVGVVAYSLGNLVSNQARLYRMGRDAPKEAAPRDGVLLRVELAQGPADPDGARPRPRVVGADVLPLWTENLRHRQEGPHIEVVATQAALNALESTEAAALSAQDPRPIAHRKRLYRERLHFMTEHLGAQWLRDPGHPQATPVSLPTPP